jgi:hypothetical protein
VECLSHDFIDSSERDIAVSSVRVLGSSAVREAREHMKTLSSSKTQQSVSKAPPSARLRIVDGQVMHASGTGKSTETSSRRGARLEEGLHVHEEHEKRVAAPSGQAARSGLRDDKVSGATCFESLILVC